MAVCANAGTSSTGAVDALPELADWCAREGIWLHVDAAYGGFALVTEEGRERLAGIDRADSVGLDAHKWFFQPYEAGVLMVRNAEHLKGAFAIGNDVLQDTVWGANHPNFADRGLQLSRAARALKIWMSVQTFGMGRVSGRRCRTGSTARGGPRLTWSPLQRWSRWRRCRWASCAFASIPAAADEDALGGP